MFAKNYLFFIVFFIVCGLGAISQLAPPPVVERTAPPEEFSAARALDFVEKIAQEPHPVGTAEHDRVKSYILEELSKMGLHPEVQSVGTTLSLFGAARGARIQNILVRIDGQGKTRNAVALSAHYDSVPHARGASDDGSGVATLLETIRAVRQAPLKNDLMFIFTDAEELGLLGAHAFVTQHPWAKEIKVALNFDARGSGGPSAMYRASRLNDFLLEGVSRAPFPFTSSLLSSLSQLVPNDSDYTQFMKSGIPSMDFVYAGGLDRYHTFWDSRDTLDPRSLQHQGSYALAMARYFGNEDLSAHQNQTEQVYFDVLRKGVVKYSRLWAAILGLFNLALFMTLWLWGRKNSFRDLGKGAGVFVLAVGAGSLAVYGLHWVSAEWRDDALLTGHASSLWVSYLLVGAGVFSLCHRRWGRSLTQESLALSTLFPGVILGFVSGLFVPSASYIFQWPFLLAAVAWVLYRPARWLSYLVSGLAWVLWVEFLYFVYTLEGGLFPQITAACFLVGLSFLFIYYLDIAPQRGRKLALSAVGVGGLVHLFSLCLIKPSSIHPTYAQLNYGQDDADKKSYWITRSTRKHDWPYTEIQFGDKTGPLPAFSSRKNEFSTARAPVKAFDKLPELNKLSHQKNGQGGETFKFTLTSPRQAVCLVIWEESKSELREIRVNGEKVEPSVKISPEVDSLVIDTLAGKSLSSWKLSYCNPPPEGIDVEVDLVRSKPESPWVLRLLDESYGFPSEISLHRPATQLPSAGSDTTWLSRKIEIK